MKKVLFGLILVLISYYYGYHEIIFMKPQSIHTWRQADGASIALQYYQNGMKFFKPQIHNYISDNGTSNYCTTGDAPVLYYSVALLYKIFGPHDYIFRLLNTLIFLLGLFYLFRLVFHFTNDFFWSAVTAVLIFTSPVLVYYGNNYLPNVTALSLVLTGCYHFFVFTSNNKNKYFVYSMLLFTLAGLLKVTALLMMFSVLGVYLLEKTGWIKTRFFQNKRKYWIYFLLAVIINLSWIIYADWYNKIHKSTYFSTTIFPIWNLNMDEIKSIISYVFSNWFSEYFNIATQIILFAALLFILIKAKKSYLHDLLLLTFLAGGIVVYIVTQFYMFHDHDYYIINLFIFAVIISVTAVITLKKEYPSAFRSVLVKAGITLFILYNVYITKTKLWDRYNDKSQYEYYEAFYTAEPFLRQLGIQPQEKVISVPDYCLLSLYLMNQEGWTDFCDYKFNKSEKVCYNQDSAGVALSVKNGAKYLIVNGLETFLLKPYLKNYATCLSGRKDGLFVFDLLNKTPNFYFKQDPEVMNRWFCGAEMCDENPQYILAENDSSLKFSVGGLLTDNIVYEGKHAVELSGDKKFGMITEIDNVRAGEKIIVRTIRKGIDGQIVVSSADGSSFYSSSSEVTGIKNQTGWEEINLEVIIPEKLHGKKIKLYMYNPSDNTVVFDNLEITRYESILP